jgi:hypothetical protein
MPPLSGGIYFLDPQSPDPVPRTNCWLNLSTGRVKLITPNARPAIGV